MGTISSEALNTIMERRVEMKKIYSDRHTLKYDYFVTEEAQVYSPISNRWLKPWTDKDGYLRITLMDINNIRKALPLSRVVMMTHAPIANMSNLEVNHKDGDKTNNELWNLEWVTTQENIEHALKNGLRCSQGENNPGHKLAQNEIFEIIDLLQETTYIYKEIASFYGVHEETIARIKRKKSWKHLTQNIVFKERSTTSRKA